MFSRNGEACLALGGGHVQAATGRVSGRFRGLPAVGGFPDPRPLMRVRMKGEG